MQKTEIMKIICIGRNYRDHIAEFDGGPLPAEPLFFLKPDTALLRNNDPFYIPDFTQEVHYECELVVRIDRLARHIAPRFAHRLYAEVDAQSDFGVETVGEARRATSNARRSPTDGRGSVPKDSTTRPPWRRSSSPSPSWATSGSCTSRSKSTAKYGNEGIRAT